MMEDFEENAQHKHFKLIKNIEDIQPDDSHVQVVGKAKGVNPSMEFNITDDSGKFPVREIPHEISEIKEGNLYRVMGEVAIDGAGVQFIAAEVVQDMKALDVELYKKSIELYKKTQ